MNYVDGNCVYCYCHKEEVSRHVDEMNVCFKCMGAEIGVLESSEMCNYLGECLCPYYSMCVMCGDNVFISFLVPWCDRHSKYEYYYLNKNCNEIPGHLLHWMCTSCEHGKYSLDDNSLKSMGLDVSQCRCPGCNNNNRWLACTSDFIEGKTAEPCEIVKKGDKKNTSC